MNRAEQIVFGIPGTGERLLGLKIGTWCSGPLRGSQKRWSRLAKRMAIVQRAEFTRTLGLDHMLWIRVGHGGMKEQLPVNTCIPSEGTTR
jgi:hypothetical protein